LAGEVAGDVLRPVISAHRDAARGVGFDPTEASGDGLADRLECGEAAAIGGDIMADDLGVEVVECGEHPDPSLRHGLHHGGVGAPEPVGGCGQDSAIVVVGRAGRLSVGREELVLVHQPQHPVAADHQAEAIPQPSPHLAMSLAAERRGR
jgi:hypothetical protein